MKKKPGKARRWLYPAGVERDYTRRLVAIADEAVQAIEPAVLRALGYRADIADPSIDTGWYQGLIQALQAGTSLSPLQDQVLGPLISEFARRTTSFNKQQFHGVLRSAYGVNVLTADPQLRDMLSVWEAENLELIKSLPTKYIDQLRGQVTAAVQSGKGLRDVVALVKKTGKVTKGRAELIARDQIGKLNGDITQARQQGIGVEEYRWRGVLDGRERSEHVAREGKTYRWDKPPEDGHPGQPIRCRCSAEAVLPDLDDLNALIVH